MIRVKEVIVVEGKYDKNTLSQVVDGTIIPTDGFGIFKDREKKSLLRRLAQERGLIILTDSDGAGFVIRNHLKGVIPNELMKQAYIPDLFGKEKRKRVPGKEGKLGVEGMKPELLLRALRQAGATILGEELNEEPVPRRLITKADLMRDGLTGTPDSGQRREMLKGRLGLPKHLTANGLLEVLNLLYSYEDYQQAVSELQESKKED